MPPAGVFLSRTSRARGLRLEAFFLDEILMGGGFGALFWAEAGKEHSVVVAKFIDGGPKPLVKGGAERGAMALVCGQGLPHFFFDRFDPAVFDFALGVDQKDQFAFAQFGAFDLNGLGDRPGQIGLKGADFGQ